MTQPVHLIFVDDDRDDRMIFKEAVADIDPRKSVTLFDDGFQLLSLLNTFVPDAIFLDMNMPGMSGFSCLEEIRKNPAWDKVAVVIYSTTGDKQTIDKAYDSGANFFIKKQHDFNEIKKSLKKFFSLDFNTIFPRPNKEAFLITA